MSDNINFTDLEQKAVRTTLEKRWAQGDIKLQTVEVDVRVADSDQDSTKCPAFYWDYADYHFLLMKTGDNKYRPQFFYQDSEEAGAGTLEFDDLAECAMALLQLQANHALSLKIESDNS